MTMPSMVNRLRSLLAFKVVSAIATVSPRGNFEAIDRGGWGGDCSPLPPWLAAGVYRWSAPNRMPLTWRSWLGIGQV